MDLHVVFQNVMFILDISTNSEVQTKLKINFITENHFCEILFLLETNFQLLILASQFLTLLRTVPPFVTAHTFCVPRDTRVS